MKIKIDLNMCIGCRRCEFACSLNHYGKDGINPKKSRIRAWIKSDQVYPVLADNFSLQDCSAVLELQTAQKETPAGSILNYNEKKKTWFREPDSGILLRCDLCGDPPDPNCVKWCPCNAIILVDDQDEIMPCTLENY